MRHGRWSMLFSLGALAAGGCATVKGDSIYSPMIDPANFVRVIDNPYYPLTPGTTYRFRSTSEDGVEDVAVTVTADTKVILGVSCVVVHDVASVNGKLREDTWDWYAQDREGNVWYFGEDTKAYERGHVDTEGSWEAGVRGAKPGIVMRAQPKVGDTYRQEYLAGEAEDQGEVVALGETVTVPAGTFTNCVKTKDWSALEPDVENKYYAPGVGVVLTVKIVGDAEREELISR